MIRTQEKKEKRNFFLEHNCKENFFWIHLNLLNAAIYDDFFFFYFLFYDLSIKINIIIIRM